MSEGSSLGVYRQWYKLRKYEKKVQFSNQIYIKYNAHNTKYSKTKTIIYTRKEQANILISNCSEPLRHSKLRRIVPKYIDIYLKESKESNQDEWE